MSSVTSSLPLAELEGLLEHLVPGCGLYKSIAAKDAAFRFFGKLENEERLNEWLSKEEDSAFKREVGKTREFSNVEGYGVGALRVLGKKV
jgi:hypothetical protein